MLNTFNCSLIISYATKLVLKQLADISYIFVRTNTHKYGERFQRNAKKMQPNLVQYIMHYKSLYILCMLCHVMVLYYVICSFNLCTTNDVICVVQCNGSPDPSCRKTDQMSPDN